MTHVLMLVGSLRAESLTAQLADSLALLLPSGVSASTFERLAELPHYSEDLDGEFPPEAVAALREALRSTDALVVATPEYNGSLPGVLKNAIDWASRPRGASVLSGLPVAVVSASPSPRGAQWAREDAVRVLTVAGAVPLATSVGVAAVHSVVSGGTITDPGVRTELVGLLRDLLDRDQVA